MAELMIEEKDSTFVIRTPSGSWEFANDATNKKLSLIFLRAWQDDQTGKPLYTFQAIAEAFGYEDRRNVNNYWREFEASEGQFARFFLRKRKVDQAVVAAVEQELRGQLQLSVTELAQRVNQRLERSDLTESNIRVALDQIPATLLHHELLYQWQAGVFHPKEEVILEEVMASLKAEKAPQNKEVLEKLSTLGVRGADEEEEAALVQRSQSEAVAELLNPELSVAQISPGVQKMVFAMNLYYWNVPLSRIGLWMGQGKSTIYGWVIGLAVALWRLLATPLSEQLKATYLYVDEKWLKIGGKWHYWFVALDGQTGLPVVAHLLPTRSQWACRWIFLKVKVLGKWPRAVITDGLAGYAASLPKVFASAKHLLCLFHHQQAVSKWVGQHLPTLSEPEAQAIKTQMKKVVQTSDVRTVKRRLQTLEEEEQQQGWGLGDWISRVRQNLGALIPSLRNNHLPRTTNEIERFFRVFQRFYKTRGGFHSVISAKRELMLFLVMYLFTKQAGSKKAPIETVFSQATQTPLYHLINDPFGSGMMKICQENQEIGEMATNSLKIPALC